MDKSKIEKINLVIKEIKNLLKNIQINENSIIKEIDENLQNSLIYKTYLEHVIEEYHLVCKQIYDL